MAGLFSAEERLLTPPIWTSVDESLPIVFIAGPIQGAPDYQTPLAKSIIEATDDVFVASPRRLEIDENFDYDTQVFWEQANLGRAAFNGITLFWLSARDHTLPYEEGRAYAQTTRFEFGQVAGRKNERTSLKAHLGIDPSYTDSGGGSERYFRYLAKAARIPIHASLDELRAAALEDLS